MQEKVTKGGPSGIPNEGKRSCRPAASLFLHSVLTNWKFIPGMVLYWCTKSPQPVKFHGPSWDIHICLLRSLCMLPLRLHAFDFAAQKIKLIVEYRNI